MQVENTQEDLKLVSKGEVYAAVDILPVLSYQIGKYGFTNLKVSGTTEFDFEMKVMVRDDYKELISVINKSIDLINEEEKNIIGTKWISVKYEKTFFSRNLVNVMIIYSFPSFPLSSVGFPPFGTVL